MTESSVLKLPPPFVVGRNYYDRTGEYTVIAVVDDKITIQRHTGERSVADATIKARIYRNLLIERGELNPLRERRISFVAGQPAGFTHDEVFPIIAATIRAHPDSGEHFITHDRIVEALIENPELRPILEQLEAADPQHKTMSWWASTMLAWFSQVWSVRGSDWEDEFEREKVQGNWAYRVRTEPGGSRAS